MKSYYSDDALGQTVYRCHRCRYDSFSLDSIQQHCIGHGPLKLPECTESESVWLDKMRLEQHVVSGTRIALGFLTWNTKDASTRGAMELLLEAHRLQDLGLESRIFWCDNGSSDGTYAAVADVFGNTACTIQNWTNAGQSHGRNQLQQAARSWNCDYLLIVDGDVQIIPYSAYAMARFLQENGPYLGCIGMNCYNCTSDDADPDVPAHCRQITLDMTKPNPPIAWTHYGMFRRSVLDQCRFDEASCFTGPGWGLEDDDYYMQMVVCGYQIANTTYFRHFHRRRNSSLRNISQSLAAKVYEDRRQYLMRKWSAFDQAKELLRRLECTRMPSVE